MNKFKVGDEVKRIKIHGYGLSIGDVVVVAELSEDAGFLKVKGSDYEYYEGHFELATTPRPHAELAKLYYSDDSLVCWYKRSTMKEWRPLTTPAWCKFSQYQVLTKGANPNEQSELQELHKQAQDLADRIKELESK